MKSLFISILLSLPLIILFSSCSQKNEIGNELETNVIKAPSSSVYTYKYVLDNVFDDEGERIEWYGTQLPNEASQFLTFSKKGKCSNVKCGEKFLLKNTHHNKTIKATINAPFSDKDGNYKITKFYIIAAGKEIYIGCSLLCLSDMNINFNREIIGSEFIETE